jgi:hypothetical protein
MLSSHFRAQLLEAYREEVGERDAIERVEDENGYLVRACAGTVLRVLLDEEAQSRNLRRLAGALTLHVKLLAALKEEAPRRAVILQDYSRQTLWLQCVKRRDLLRAQYEEQRRVAFVRTILLPQLLADATLWHRLHVELCKRLLRVSEPAERMEIALLERAERADATVRSDRGTLAREEAMGRAVISAERDTFDATAATAVAKLHAEGGYVSHATLVASLTAKEDADFYLIVDEEIAARVTNLVSTWAEGVLRLFQELAIAEVSWVCGIFQRAALECDMLRTVSSEACGRLFIFVEESNTFTSAKEQLLLTRQMEACCRIQRACRGMLARLCARDRRLSVERHRTACEEFERREYESARKTEMTDTFSRIVEPLLSAALSQRTVYNKLLLLSRRIIGRAAEGFLDRHLLGIERASRFRNKLAAHAEALLRAAPLLQRVGRGFLIREEVFDVLVEEWEIQEAERQRRCTAGLVIWWAWREFRDARKARLEKEIRERRRQAAVRIQSLFRGVHHREYFKLVMLPRHWVATVKKIQKACRGYQGRKGLRKMKSLRIIHSASRSYLSRFESERRRLSPYATTIQCFWRLFLARRQLNRRRAALLLRQRNTFQSGMATPIQAAFRGYTQRKHTKVQLAVTRALRKEKVEALAAVLDDDFWRIGRAFIARRTVFSASVRREQKTVILQRFALYSISLLTTSKLEHKKMQELQKLLMLQSTIVVQSFLRSKLANLVHQQRCELNQRLLNQATALHLVLAPLIAAYRCRRTMAKLWTVVFRAAMKIQCLARRGQAIQRRNSLRQVKIAQIEEENLQGAGAMLSLHWRRLQARRHLAAAVIQRSYVSQRLRLTRNRELMNARNAEVMLKIHGLLRDESFGRRVILQTENGAAKLFKQQLRKAQLLLPEFGYLKVKLLPPPGFELLEEDRRLELEEEYLGQLHVLRETEYRRRHAAFSASMRNALCTGELRTARSEGVMRSRIARDELDTRRLIAIASLSHIRRIFEAKRTLEVANEAAARRKLEAMREEAFGSCTKKYTAWLITTAGAPPAISLAPSKAPDSATEKKLFLRTQLRPFQIPIDLKDPKDVSQSEFHEIFSAALRHNRSATLSAPSALCRPKLLPTLPAEKVETPESLLVARSAIPPLSTLSADEQTLLDQHDQFMVTCAVRKLIKVGDDGTLDTRVLLGHTVTGDELAAPLVELVAQPLLEVRHLRLSGMTFSDRAFLKVLRYAVDRHRPLESIDLSHNINITDITACHLVAAVDALPSLVAIDVTATSVSVAKRQLIAHMLERKNARCGAERALNSMPSALSVRRPRPLQIPRRNGWSTTYRLAPIPESKDIRKGECEPSN